MMTRNVLAACGVLAVFGAAAGEKYPWRGFLLDEARHFFGKAVVAECLDEMRKADLNVFHWHLTDDQGWRLELPEFPELTKEGAARPSTPPYGADRGSDGVAYGPRARRPSTSRSSTRCRSSRARRSISPVG